MTQIDQFESIFRSASRSLFEYKSWDIQSVMTICDGDQQTTRQFEANVKSFLSNAVEIEPIQWSSLAGSDFSTVDQLVKKIEHLAPDMICCHRNLHIPASDHPFSLGVYVDVLTQVAKAPVLLLPDPESEFQWHNETHHVMAITDHLDGDNSIVTAALKLTATDGKLYLTHIEDERAFRRIINVVEKIPEIDSDIALKKIAERLLLDPQNFIDSCQKEIEKQEIPVSVEAIVKLGHSISDYGELVDQLHIDLLVMHTRDDEQLAMHGLAYPLTIEFRQTPLLLI